MMMCMFAPNPVPGPAEIGRGRFGIVLKAKRIADGKVSAPPCPCVAAPGQTACCDSRLLFYACLHGLIACCSRAERGDQENRQEGPQSKGLGASIVAPFPRPARMRGLPRSAARTGARRALRSILARSAASSSVSREHRRVHRTVTTAASLGDACVLARSPGTTIPCCPPLASGA